MEKAGNKLRMVEKVFVGLIILSILLAVAAVPVSFWPHYEKKAYLETVPLTQADVEADRMDADESLAERKAPLGVSGYPSTGISTKITSMEDLEANKYEAICLEIDVKDLKATGFYEQMQLYSGPGTSSNFSWKSNVSKGSVSHSTNGAPLHTSSSFRVLWNRTNAIYAQYYVLTLEDGSRVFLLLNDTAVPLPKSGTVKLPLALWNYLFLERGMSEVEFAKEHGVKLTDDQDVRFLDAAGNWGRFYPGVEKAHERQVKQAVLLVIAGIIGAIAGMILLCILVSQDKSLGQISNREGKN